MTFLIQAEILRRTMANYFADLHAAVNVSTEITSIDPSQQTITLADPVPAGHKFALMEVSTGQMAGFSLPLGETRGGNSVILRTPSPSVMPLQVGDEVAITGGPLGRSADYFTVYSPVVDEVDEDVDVSLELTPMGYRASKNDTAPYFTEVEYMCRIKAKRKNVLEPTDFMDSVMTLAAAEAQFLGYITDYRGPMGAVRTIEPPTDILANYGYSEDESSSTPGVMVTDIQFALRLMKVF